MQDVGVGLSNDIVNAHKAKRRVEIFKRSTTQKRLPEPFVTVLSIHPPQGGTSLSSHILMKMEEFPALVGKWARVPKHE